MTKDHENRTERILSSTEGMTPAEAPAFLFTRIEARLSDSIGYVPKSRLWLAMVGAAVLVIMNVGTLLLSGLDKQTTTPATGVVASSGAYQQVDLSLDSFNPSSYR